MRFEKSVFLEMPRAELWLLLANTEKFNREIGLPAIRYSFSPKESGGSEIQAETTVLGQRLVWQERPFEWVEPHWFQVQRIYGKGPFHQIVGGVRLEEQGEGTLATCFAEVTPRNLVGRMLAPVLIGKKASEAFVKACRNFEGFFKRRLKAPFPSLTGGDRAVNRSKLEEASAKLLKSGASEFLVNSLRSRLETASDSDLIRLRPFEMADAWGEDRFTVLKLCLDATRAGILDMEWSVLCPSCRGVKQSYSHLRDLQPKGHCDACNIEYGADFDQFVEVRFTVNPNVRKVEERIYCIGGPMNTPHVHAQLVVPAGANREANLALSAGRYSVRSLQIEASSTLVVSPTIPTTAASFRIDKTALTPESREIASGQEVSVSLVNDMNEAVLVKIEAESWGDRGASASLVTSLQEFRDLFSSEVLAPGLELSIRNLALLFSDLKGSTRMYDSIGDAPAYGLVRRHFEFLADIIADNRGALVKTIGDAVMAAFLSPADALRAGAQIQRDVHRLNAQAPQIAPLVLKLGAHCGPCIAVNANDLLDYFGTTVNLAQRAQGESDGGDIVITEPMLRDPAVETALKDLGARVERFQSELKGFQDEHILYRLRF